jgi:hypothetical protein
MFQWSLRLIEVTKNVFDGVSLCLFVPFTKDGSIFVFQSAAEVASTIQTYAAVLDIIADQSSFYSRIFSTLIHILYDQSVDSFSHLPIKAIVYFINKKLHQQLFHNSSEVLNADLFASSIVDIFDFHVMHARVELRELMSQIPEQFSSFAVRSGDVSSLSRNQKRKSNISSEVSGKDKAKRVAGGVTQSTHCVNHFAKELGVSKKGCVMKKGKLCSFPHSFT